MKTKTFGLLLLATLAGCSGMSDRVRPEMGARVPPSRLDEIAFINTLRSAHQPTNFTGCFTGSELRPFEQPSAEGNDRNYAGAENDAPGDADHCVTFRDVPEVSAGQSPTPPAAQVSMRRYIDAGFGLSDLYCERFFISAVASQARRRFARDTVSDVQTLVSSILSLASASEAAVGITAASIGAVEQSFTNFDEAFLVAPDMAEVRDLVFAAQAEFRSRYDSELPDTFEAARSVIERYAGVCTFTSMRRLISTSLNQTREELVQSVEGAGATRGGQQNGSSKPPPAAAVVPVGN